MGDEGVSEEIRRFIFAHIASVAQLETLLLLQTNARQEWTVDMIARELRIEPAGAQEQLNGLCSSGLVVQNAGNPALYHFAPKTPDLQAATVALAQAYLIRRVTVIGLIFAKPSEKIRVFSDAFRFRKDPPNG